VVKEILDFRRSFGFFYSGVSERLKGFCGVKSLGNNNNGALMRRALAGNKGFTRFY